MAFIQITAIDLRLERNWFESLRNERNRQVANTRVADFPEDDLEQPVGEDEETEAPASEELMLDYSTAPDGVFYSEVVNTENIREIYPRKGNRKGTRIVFLNGAARPVKETYDVVKNLLARAGVIVTTA